MSLARRGTLSIPLTQKSRMSIISNYSENQELKVDFTPTERKQEILERIQKIKEAHLQRVKTKPGQFKESSNNLSSIAGKVKSKRTKLNRSKNFHKFMNASEAAKSQKREVDAITSKKQTSGSRSIQLSNRISMKRSHTKSYALSQYNYSV